MVRVLAEAVEKAPANASVRRVIRMSRDLQRGRASLLLAQASLAVGSVFCGGVAAAIVITVSPNSPVGILLMLPFIFLIAGGMIFGRMFYAQIKSFRD